MSLQKKITVKAYAKINLMLDINYKRTDGYHDLFMIMQSIGVFDTVTVETNNSKRIKIVCDADGVPTDKTNIAHKCAKAFFKAAGIRNPGIRIDIINNE